MDHFAGRNENERYNNDLLNEIRRTNVLLEQLAQLLQPKETIELKPAETKRNYQRRK